MVVKTSREWTTVHAQPLRVCKIFFTEEGGGRLEELTFKILKHFYFIAVYTVQMLIKNCNSAGGLLPTDVFLTVHRQRCQDLVV